MTIIINLFFKSERFTTFLPSHSQVAKILKGVIKTCVEKKKKQIHMKID